MRDCDASISVTRMLGVRRQSEAATALWIAWNQSSPSGQQLGELRRIQSGVALRLPPHSKIECLESRIAALWSAPAERSGDGALDSDRIEKATSCVYHSPLPSYSS